MLVLLLALFISIFSVAALQPPTIFTIHPLFGAANELTSIQIHGQGFPSQRENIVDVGLIVTLPLGPQCNGQGADLLGNSTALAHTEAVRLSCLWSIFHLTETEIGCRLSALHGDYRVPSPLLADAPPMFSVREGFVYVITADDPSVIRFNTAVRFRFLPACHLHTNPTVCGAENCSWCDFGGRCLSSPADCTERCSTAHFRLSCAELYWTISLSVLIALVVPALVYFAITRQKMLRFVSFSVVNCSTHSLVCRFASLGKTLHIAFSKPLPH